MAFLMSMLYFVAKWLLLIVDIVFSYVQELCGLNMDYSSLDGLFSEDADIVFRLIYANKHTVVAIMRNLVALAIFFIILFSIAAIIWGQYKSYKDGKPPTPMENIKNLFKYFGLLILTPMIAIVSIVAGDLLLQTFYKATNVNSSVSLGTQIFTASSTAANCYKTYAQNGRRIPIRCDFRNDKAVLNYFSDKPINSEFISYISNSRSVIFSTAMMFKDETFMEFEMLTNADDLNAYNKIYDANVEYAEKVQNGELASIYANAGINARQEEYYVMADVIDFAMNTSVTIYYKTVEEIFQSVINSQLSEPEQRRIFEEIAGTCFNASLQFLKEDGSQLGAGSSYYDNFTNDNWVAMTWTSTYYGVGASGEPTINRDYKYYHFRGETDEYFGASYVVAVEKTVKSGNITYSYYQPLTNYYTYTPSARFRTEFLKRGHVVAAKGLFSESKYPTAIKQNDSKQVVFYREKIENIDVGEASEAYKLTWENDPFKKQSIWTRIKMFFKVIFDPESLMPHFYLNEDAIKQAYQSEIDDVLTLNNGKMRIGYMMSSQFPLDFLTEAVSESKYEGVNLQNIYDIKKINFLILVGSTLILIKVSINAIFALIERAYDMMILFMYYPTACATLPLTDKGYKRWSSLYFSKLFSTYGLVLGINFVFLLFPVIQSIEFFQPSDIARTKSLRRFGALFFAFTDVNGITRMLNFAFSIMMELVALTMIQKVPAMISSFVANSSGSVDDVTASDASSQVYTEWFGLSKDNKGKVWKGLEISATLIPYVGQGMRAWQHRDKIKKTAYLLTHKKEAALKFMKAHAPMSSVVREGQDKAFLMKKKKAKRDAEKELEEKMSRSTTEGASSGDANKEEKKNEVQSALDAYIKKDTEYTKSLDFDPNTGANKVRAAEESKIQSERAQGLRSSRDDDDENDSQGGGGDDTPDFDSMTKDEIKNYIKDTKHQNKNIDDDAKAKRTNSFGRKENFMSEEQKEKREKNERNLLRAKDALKNAKSEAKGLGKAKRTSRRLQAKIDKGKELTEEEQQQKVDAENKIDTINDRKQRSTDRKTEEKNKQKSAKEAQKAREKAKKQEHKDYLMFTGKGALNAFRRNSRMYEITSNIEDLKTQLAQKGISQDVSSMSDEEVKALGENEDQQKIIDAFISERNKMNNLLKMQSNEFNAKAQVDSHNREYKNIDVAGKGRSHKNKRLTQKYSDVEESEQKLDDVKKRIAEIDNEGVNGENYKEYQKLQMMKSQLVQHINESNTWDYQQANGKALRKEKNEQRKENYKNNKRQTKADENIGDMGYSREYMESLNSETERLKNHKNVIQKVAGKIKKAKEKRQKKKNEKE